MMHIAFYTARYDEMVDFYVNKLGFKYKYDVKFEVYTGYDNRPQLQQIAKEHPEWILNAYIEVCQGQFIELFPIHQEIDGNVSKPVDGYHHFALIVDDIHAAKEELISKGVPIDTDISIGPSGTYQMWTHDPDGNKFEVMQYTEKSMQLKGDA